MPAVTTRAPSDVASSGRTVSGSPRPGLGAGRRKHPSTAATMKNYGYVLPALTLVLGVVYAGIVYTGYTSTLDWDGIAPAPEQVGLGNYRDIAQDDIFWGTLWHLLLFFVLTVPVQMGLGLLVALLLQTRVLGGVVVKFFVFVPVVLAPAVVGTAFRQLLSADGAVNTALEAVGLGMLAQPWLAQPSTALVAVAAINVWQWTGFSFLLYQAALSQLDETLFEAARLDGASVPRMVVSLVVPLLRGTHLTLLVVGCIGSLKTFDLVYVLTGGGPSHSTELISTYLYSKSVVQFDVGYGAALTIVLLALSVVLTVAQSRTDAKAA